MGIHTFWGESTNMSSGSASKDPRYERAVQDLDTGAWEKAADAIQGLLQEYPSDRDQLTPMLTSARLRASVSGKRIRGRSGLATFLNRRRRTQLLVAILLLLVAAGTFGIYRFWLGPLRAEQALTQAVATQVEAGEKALAAANLTEAEKRFDSALALAPTSEEAEAGLIETKVQQDLLEAYIQCGRIVRQGPKCSGLGWLPGHPDPGASVSGCETAYRPDCSLGQRPRAFRPSPRSLWSGTVG